MSAITAEIVSELIDYDPKEGRFWWKKSRGGVKAGRQAGTLHSCGCVVVSVMGRLIKAHRLAWLLVYGESPGGQIDHINGNRADNRISNLRLATSKENQQNRRRANRNSRSGLLGASWDAKRGLWQARIKVDGRQLYIGRYESAEEAHAAYVKAKASVHPFGTLAKE